MARKKNKSTDGAAAKPFARTAEALGVPLFNAHFKRHFNTKISIEGISLPGNNNLAVTLTSDAFPQITLSFQPACQTDKYFMRTEHLAVSKIEDEHERIFPVYDYFIKYLCKRLENVTYDRLLELVRDEEFHFSDSASVFRTGDMERPFYGWSGQWRSFLCRRALVRNLDSTIQIVNPKIHVGIAEAECHYATLPMSPNLSHFYNYPCVQRKLSEAVCRDKVYEVELSEADIIMGTRGKLEHMLDGALRDTCGMDMVTINSTCVSYVIGEDYEDIGAAAQRECGLPVFYSSSAINNEIEILARMVRRYLDEGGGGKVKPDPHSINLFGFQNTRDVEECLAPLRKLGIRENIRFYPVIDFNELKKIARAPVNVVFPSNYYIDLYSALFSGERQRVLSPDAPYGPRLTRAWIEQIAAETKTNKNAAKLIAAMFLEIEPEWTALRGRAARHKLGFVLDHFDFTTLLNPKSYWAMQPFSLMEEMGFGMEILFYKEKGFDAEFVRSRLHGVLEHPDKLSVRTFKTPDDLERLLGKSQCSAFFSDYSFDPRLTSSGKSQFSLRDFEMGMHGAVRTLDRLIRICELPFYKEYSAYLSGRPLG